MWIQLDTDKDLTPSDTLDYETSAAIRAAEVSDMGLEADQYDTVLIDGIEWYVLKVQDNKALLLSWYLHPQQMHMVNDIQKYVDEEQAERFFPDVSYVASSQTDDTIWATSDLHDYLNGEWLSMHPDAERRSSRNDNPNPVLSIREVNVSRGGVLVRLCRQGLPALHSGCVRHHL